MRSGLRSRFGVGMALAGLMSALLVGAPVSSAVADDVPAFLVESGVHPDAAALGPANGLVLKDGNGGLRLAASCSTALTANQVRVERTFNGRASRVCFDVVFRPAVLNLEVPSSFGVKAGKQPLEVTYSIDGEEDQISLAPTRSGSVDLAQTGESTVVLLEVLADATDVPVTEAAFPRTAIGQVRSAAGSCVGTLVDRSWVLTAASCVAVDPATVVAGVPVEPVRVLFGADIANDKTTHGSGPRGVAVSRVEPAGNGADAVMLKLAEPVDDITVIAPASTAPSVGESLAFTGYGRTASAWVPLTAHTYPYSVATVAASLVATGSGTGLCAGDGGAPGVRTVNGVKSVVAIASTASQAGCLGSGIPTGTASVTSVRIDTIAPWIATTIQNGRVLPGIAGGQVLEIENLTQPGICITSKDRTAAAGDFIVGVNCAETWQSRRWELVEVAAGTFAMRNYVQHTLCITANAADDGVAQATCDTADSKQRWTFKEQTGGSVSVVNAASGKALVATSASTPGLTTDTGAQAQRWKYRAVTQMCYDVAPVGSYVSFVKAVGGKTLVAGAGQATTADVSATSPLGTRQTATFKVLPGLTDAGCYTFESVATPGKFLHMATNGVIEIAVPAAGIEYRATWCAETAAHGTGVSFTIATDSWRALRSHQNGLVYGGTSWYAGVPYGDDTVDYVPDTAWVVSAPWAPAALESGQVLEIQSVAQAGKCLSTLDRSPAAGPVIAGIGCAETWQMRNWELIETSSQTFVLRNYVNRTMCLGAADAAGSGVVHVACDVNAPTQQWSFGAQAKGTWNLRNIASGKVLSAPSASVIGLAAPSTSAAVQWRIRNVTQMRYDIAPIGGLVSLQTAVGAKSLVAVGGSAQASVSAVNGDSASSIRQAATFKVVAGLADATCYSFESTSTPGLYLDFKGPAGGINLDAAATPDKKTTSTWCAQQAEFGSGLTFISYNNSWRTLRSYKNGLVYGGASWFAGFPEADDSANYVPDTAWALAAPWVPAP